MPKLNVETVGDLLYCAYANLGMAQAAIEAGVVKYGTLQYMIRSRLFHGLRKGTLQMGSMFRRKEATARTTWCGPAAIATVPRAAKTCSLGARSGRSGRLCWCTVATSSWPSRMA